MIRGVDTTFLIQVEIAEAHAHERAMRYLRGKILRPGKVLAIAPQVLAEFVHVTTDPKRFRTPLGTGEALAKADLWWRAKETRQVFPNADSMGLFLEWMNRYRLGRKRLSDTLLAATYHTAGARGIVTFDAGDFSVFEGFEVIEP